MRKARNANKNFLTGTAALAIAVIVLVFVFVLQADELSKDKETVRQRDMYEFIVTDDFEGSDISVYLNDSLIARHSKAGDTIRCSRLADESSLLILDNTSQKVTILPVPIQKGTFYIQKPKSED